MVDKPNKPEDFENMTDEDFLALDENDFSGNVPEGETNLTDHRAEDIEDEKPTEELLDPVDDESDPDGGEPDVSFDGDNPDSPPEGEGIEGKDPHAEGGKPAEVPKEPVVKEENAEVPKKAVKETPAKAGYYKLPDGMDTARVDEAIGFFQKLSVPFKADGKDFVVRSPEDAIRLIQQGVNYSRRLAEMKPMKALNRTLQDNGLADQSKLSFAIDLMKGDKAAITQLLKSHNIDPMDLDTEKESGYQANNYGGNTQDNDFRDALDETLATPEGQALVTHINRDWDKSSKARLREDPSILGNLQNLKSSGVYDKVVEELTYQKSIGYLINVPFLQAFDQVGEAMKKAGVFGNPQQPAANGNSMAPVQGQNQNQPVASGARKSVGMKNSGTNPHLSSTPPSRQAGNTQKPEPDFAKLSDEEFLKMAPPP